MKTAVVVLSDPKNGEEALGRLFNALAAVYDMKQKKQEVQLLFQGTGTRWAAPLTRSEHPLHALYDAVKDKIAGVSCGCADVFGVREEVEKSGFDLLGDNPVPGTRGVPSFARLAAEGYTILTF